MILSEAVIEILTSSADLRKDISGEILIRLVKTWCYKYCFPLIYVGTYGGSGGSATFS